MLYLSVTVRRLASLTLLVGLIAAARVIPAQAAFHLEYVEQPETYQPYQGEVDWQAFERAWNPPPLPTPKPAPVQVAVPVSRPTGDVWDCIAQKESGNQPLGCAPHCGRLQWLPSTWRSAVALYNRGKDPKDQIHADLPQNATYAQEVAVARVWLAHTSWGQWPNTSRMCGAR